jgi:hypothetical protein
MSDFTPILTNTSFVDEFLLAKNQFTEDKIDAFIISMQRKVLIDLLGMDLYLKFGADISAPAAGSKFNHLKLGTTYTDPEIYCYQNTLSSGVDTIVDYSGIVKMLKIFTWVEILKKKSIHDTIIGATQGSGQNGINLSLDQISGLTDVFHNEAVDLYRAAQKFIIDNNDQETTSTAITDNANNTYTALVPSTKYLSVGDTVDVGGTDYTVTALTANVSITFSKTSGSSMAAVQDIKWQAFPTFAGKRMKKQMFGGNY